MYDSIHDLPIVCQLNLPEAALTVYREAFNRSWSRSGEHGSRYRTAQEHAWSVVREKFEREKATGRWVPRAAQLEPRMAPAENKRAAQ